MWRCWSPRGAASLLWVSLLRSAAACSPPLLPHRCISCACSSLAPAIPSPRVALLYSSLPAFCLSPLVLTSGLRLHKSSACLPCYCAGVLKQEGVKDTGTFFLVPCDPRMPRMMVQAASLPPQIKQASSGPGWRGLGGGARVAWVGGWVGGEVDKVLVVLGPMDARWCRHAASEKPTCLHYLCCCLTCTACTAACAACLTCAACAYCRRCPWRPRPPSWRRAPWSAGG